MLLSSSVLLQLFCLCIRLPRKPIVLSSTSLKFYQLVFNRLSDCFHYYIKMFCTQGYWARGQLHPVWIHKPYTYFWTGPTFTTAIRRITDCEASNKETEGDMKDVLMKRLGATERRREERARREEKDQFAVTSSLSTLAPWYSSNACLIFLQPSEQTDFLLNSLHMALVHFTHTHCQHEHLPGSCFKTYCIVLNSRLQIYCAELFCLIQLDFFIVCYFLYTAEIELATSENQ